MVVYFVAVAVPLVYELAAVSLKGFCCGHYFAWICSQPHCSALVLNALLVGHYVYYGMGSVRIELGAVGSGKPYNVPCVFDHCHLEAQAYSKEGNFVFSCVFYGEYLAFYSSVSEASGNENAVRSFEKLVDAAFIYILRLYPVYIHFDSIVYSGMLQRLGNR